MENNNTGLMTFLVHFKDHTTTETFKKVQEVARYAMTELDQMYVKIKEAKRYSQAGTIHSFTARVSPTQRQSLIEYAAHMREELPKLGVVGFMTHFAHPPKPGQLFHEIDHQFDAFISSCLYPSVRDQNRELISLVTPEKVYSAPINLI